MGQMRFSQRTLSERFKLKSEQLYKIWTYDEISEKIKALEAGYPELISVTTSQKAYGLEYLDCNDGKECETFILTITNKANTDSTKQHVFISGGVHGNERIGESTSIELTEMLLKNYESNAWINYLLNHRVIVIIPMTNAQGYYLNEREEFRWVDPKSLKPDTNNEYSYADSQHKNGKMKLIMDPNRDFPYHLKDQRCLQTVTAQTVYKVFEEHPFSLGITFHAGETSITYPWGAGNHIVGKPIRSYGFVDGKSDDAPDKKSFQEIVQILKNTAGAYSGMKMYKTGPISDVVYAVEGGMEDWAYAAGWENQENKQHGENYQPVVYNCTTQYSQDEIVNTDQIQQRENNYEHVRTDMILIETSDDKFPAKATLGVRNENNNYQCVLYMLENAYYEKLDEAEIKKCQNMDGHIPRNIRVALNMIDMAAPYVHVSHVEIRNNKLDIEWKVGGSKQVDDTELFVKPFNCDKIDSQIQSIFQDYLTSINQDEYEVSDNKIINDHGSTEQFSRIIESNFVKMKSNQGFGTLNFDDKKGIQQNFSKFHQQIPMHTSCLAMIVMAQTDQDVREQIKDRVQNKLDPQSYFTRERVKKSFLYQFKHKGQPQSDYISYYNVFSNLHIVRP